MEQYLNIKYKKIIDQIERETNSLKSWKESISKNEIIYYNCSDLDQKIEQYIINDIDGIFNYENKVLETTLFFNLDIKHIKIQVSYYKVDDVTLLNDLTITYLNNRSHYILVDNFYNDKNTLFDDLCTKYESKVYES